MQDDPVSLKANLEILEEKPRRKILLAIFIEVFLGFFRDIILAIWNFFKQYLLLIWFYIRFIVNPDATNHEMHREKAIHYSKHTFELILIFTGALIFCIKQGWLTSASERNNVVYSNDIQQWIMEVVLFLMYAGCYFIILFLLVLLGRLLRKFFSPGVSSRNTDIVFIHLNNIFFITAAICSFIIRFDDSAKDVIAEGMHYDFKQFVNVLLKYFGITFAIIIMVFFVRLTMLNKLPFLKSILYITLVPAIVWSFLFFCELFISVFMAGL